MLNLARARISTGISGLDALLRGGVLPGRAYLVVGATGSGKTIAGLHFLAGSRGLFIALTESEQHIREDAAALGFELDGITFLDLTAEADLFSRAETYDIFSPAEVERES